MSETAVKAMSRDEVAAIQKERGSFYRGKRETVETMTVCWPKPPVPYETADGEVLVVSPRAAECLREAEDALAEIKQGPLERNQKNTAENALRNLESVEAESPHCRGVARRLADEIERVVTERSRAWRRASRGISTPATEAFLETV